MRRIRSGIERVVRRFRPWSEDQRLELIQESLTRVFVSLRHERFRGESSLRTYAQTVARNVCLEQTRKRDGLLAVQLDDPDRMSAGSIDPERRLLRDEEHRRNVRAFAALPADSRAMLLAIFVEELTYAEVAERFGVSENTVKSRVFRSRAARRRPGRSWSQDAVADDRGA